MTVTPNASVGAMSLASVMLLRKKTLLPTKHIKDFYLKRKKKLNALQLLKRS
jgi:hypothetical protein